jgi:hypothetical protein
MRIEKYKDSHKYIWDTFISKSDDGQFIFYRDFIEYHKARFEDHSILVFDQGKLIAVIPACFKENAIYAHPGLPFSAIILSKSCKWSIWPQVIEAILNYLKEQKFRLFSLTIIPTYYSLVAEETQVYFLRNSGFKLANQKLSCVIALSPKFKHQISEKIPKYISETALIEFESKHYESFHDLLVNKLDEKYKSAPLHTLEEILTLKNKFSDNIELVCAFFKDELVGGILLFKYKTTFKAQYIISIKNNISDLLIRSIIEKYKSQYNYFDLGTSNSLENGQLNMGNLEFKIKRGGVGYRVEKYDVNL